MSRNFTPGQHIRYSRWLLAFLAFVIVLATPMWAKTPAKKASAKKAAVKVTKTSVAKKKSTPAKSAPKKSTVAASKKPATKKSVQTASRKVVLKQAAYRKVAVTKVKKTTKKRVVRSPWTSPNFINGEFDDMTAGDDPMARQAAESALGKLNGTVVVADAQTGRILTVVNQKTAYKSGFQPCSTIKVPVALAALSESVVDRLTQIRLYGNTKMAMTEALARSNNQYFASLGEKLGFERVSYYARLFGLGEKASLGIPEEQPGILPSKTPNSGMGMMTSFGDGITLTPLELAAIMGSVANGGTLYYLQYPKTQQEAAAFEPKVKRKLDIADLVGEIKPGMMGAVEYGTARRIGFQEDLPIYGKTGTCTDTRTPTHLGWFGSFTEIGHDKIVVVVLLTGASAASGGSAAGVGGQVYRNLVKQDYYAHRERVTPHAQSTNEVPADVPSSDAAPQSGIAQILPVLPTSGTRASLIAPR